ncbi:diacylglycerol/lipid kinase family protein [Halopseudomonas laoshanensis]|uniref:diacylglycerol/lipid kinase family protein n=1 Tax=Halopseudomonas laoshanensis TaxID=2268758 RepID=UPI003735F3E5
MTQPSNVSEDSIEEEQAREPMPELTGNEPFFMVMNTGSGSQKAQDIQDTIARVMQESNRRYELMAVDDGAELIPTAKKAVALAREQGGIVVAVGGDGTLNAVSQVVLGSGVPFGILPQGTFNYFGRAYGISQETEIAARCLVDARIQPVNVGLLNDKVFLVNASLGLYPQLLEDREAYKQRFGRSRLVALWSALATLFRAHRQLKVQIDHEGKREVLRTPTIVVDNNALQLKHMGLDRKPEVKHSNSHLVAITSKPLSTLNLYGILLRGLLSRLGEDEHVISFGFNTMTVRLGAGRKRTKVAMDGEISYMRSPLIFKVAEHQLPLLVARDPELREIA